MTTTGQLRHDLITTLEDRGFRLTKPRREVTTAIETQADAFTAEDLCESLPAVGRATVYRTIKLLVDTGALCKLAMPDGAPKYSLARVGHHHHTVCVRCGKVSDFRDTTVERMLRSLAKEVDGQIVGHLMEVYVDCSDCVP
ncbi:MAG: Fur family transcriptional regulator [Chloroflexi bacterium]|nr:Fur family transcriptional regulator [Chloroflexota bacterium]